MRKKGGGNRKKLVGVLSTSAMLFTCFAPTVMAAEFGEPMDGTTRVEITDFLVVDDLPTYPGIFTLDDVPDIDFGEHTVAQISANTTVNGTFDGALQASDFRPLEASKTEALELISEYTGVEDTTELTAAWENAVVAGDWVLTVSATNLTDDIASALTINGENVLESATTLPISYVSGTFDHINELTSEAPTLTVKANTPVGEYTGTVTYTAVDSI
ncbi:MULTISPECIES: hypothetical protein [Enterococcus]|uniref:WxL domain-containing protein n=1 Tax=Enterococcus faecium EnGen0003 TaxID=1138901 RepID=A0A828ZQN8_ENTFC|nr:MULTISPECIES: hypothetical protein [Enterococcus]EEV51226.1 predicted protein [Enterococcus faecium 1,141,733]EGP4935333.1 hypothetical protein [Enterococcus faecium]EGP4974756.1 hypothetical protein [Enterococcus faecium]EGP5050311.1 hypothetical protein [Enterococcus faecium]EGP5072961.1 hypothetical protein [Enterococcus faecium]